MLTDEQIFEAYDHGNEVAKRGGRAAECPYAIGSELRERWTLGYDDGGGCD